MAKYIELDVAKKAFQNMDAGRKYGSTLLTPEEFAEYLDELPFADVVPVVYGEWVRPHWKGSNYCYDCSVCGCEVMCPEYKWGDKKIYTICPRCGAKLKGVKND